jgi:hypothetical protein
MSENNGGLHLNVVAADGKTPAMVLLGNAFHELKDQTVAQYNTDSLNDFIEYVKSQVLPKSTIYFSEDTVALYPENIDRHTHAIARCELSESSYLRLVQSKINSKIGIGQMDDFLSTFRDKINKDGVELLDKVRDFKVSKVTTIQRQKLQTGDYMYNVKREGAGQGDVQFPEKVVFTVPLFENLDDTIEIEAEVWFDYEEAANGPVCSFMLRNLDIDNHVAQAKKDTVLDALEQIKIPKYWGSIEKHVQDNGWMYKENKLPGNAL